MKEHIATIIAALLAFVLVSFIFSWPVMMLWNYCLVDAVTGIKEISWLQALGLNVLCNILFNKSLGKSND